MPTDISQNLPFWLCWLAGLLLCAHQVVHAFRRRESVLGMVPVICLMYGYFYVIQSGAVGLSLSHRVAPWVLALGQFVALISLVGFLVGWHKGVGTLRIAKRSEPGVNLQFLFQGGLGAALVGLAGMYSFYIYFGAGDFTSSAYWYLLYHVFYPGMAVCVGVAARDARFRQASVVLTIIVLSALFITPWVISVRRSPLFTFVVIFIYGYYLARPYLVNRAVVVAGLIFSGVVMLLFVTIRDYSHGSDGSWTGQKLQKVTATDVLLGKAYDEGDNEFLYNCCLAATCYELDRFQWGTSYLSLTTHWIPRQWWPDKPGLAQGWLNPVTWPDIRDCTGIMMTPGSTYSGVGEAFQDFSWFTPLFWAALGWLLGRLYHYVVAHPGSVAAPVYVGMIGVTHLLIAQGFAAAFVPGMIYMVTPILVFAATGQFKAAPAVRRKPRLAFN